MLESGVLANKKFAEYALDNFVFLIGAPKGNHGMYKAPGPNKGEEVDTCSKYPAVGACDAHNRLNSELRQQFKLTDIQSTPYTVVLEAVYPEESKAADSGPVTGPDSKPKSQEQRTKSAVKPVWKEVFSVPGEWTSQQLQRKMMSVEKGRSTEPRVSFSDYTKYKKAMQLAKEGEISDSRELLSALQRKKHPDRFSNLLNEALRTLPEKGVK